MIVEESQMDSIDMLIKKICNFGGLLNIRLTEQIKT